MPDAVNSPSHYQGFSNGAEVIDIIEHLIGNRYSAVKYIARAGRKAGADELEDLKKAQWHINREVNRIAAERGRDDGSDLSPGFASGGRITDTTTYNASVDTSVLDNAELRPGDLKLNFGRTAQWTGDMWVELLRNKDIEAVQYLDGNAGKILIWLGGYDWARTLPPVGDWILKNKGRVSTLTDEEFKLRYPIYA